MTDTTAQVSSEATNAARVERLARAAYQSCAILGTGWARIGERTWNALPSLAAARWRAMASAVLAAVDTETVRLLAIEAAAREYAESRRAWEASLDNATEGGLGVDAWLAIELRQETARANLLALFSEPPDRL